MFPGMSAVHTPRITEQEGPSKQKRQLLTSPRPYSPHNTPQRTSGLSIPAGPRVGPGDPRLRREAKRTPPAPCL